jgi:chemotaxis protein histidine kinase CheA
VKDKAGKEEARKETESIFFEFKEEALKLISSARKNMEKLQGGFRQDTYQKVFSELHTIKGEAGFFGLDDIALCLHSLEDSLEVFRERGTIDFEKFFSELSFLESRLDSAIYSGDKSFSNTLKILSEFASKYSERLGKKTEVEFSLPDSPDTLNIPTDVVSKLEGPLAHILKNAIEHGIESEDERTLAGKPPVGKIYIRSSFDKRNLRISCEDDGRGADMDKFDVFKFATSSRRKPNIYAGRGVGLFIVKSAVKELSGNVKIRSKKGKGTVIEIKIPRQWTKF